ncbi:MAG: hypothetical protein ACFFDW_00815 [Candidatus Thorarchaeota archaeon]
MNSDKQLKLVNIFLGLLITGEALALIIGMNINTDGNEWLTTANYTLLAIDLVSGILIAALSFKLEKKKYLAVLFFTLAVIVGSHIFRNIDFVTNPENHFVFNVPLLIFNNVKLLGALYSIALIFYRWMNWERDKKTIIEELE